MTSPVLLDVVDGVATLTLNRPDALNALSFEMMEALSEATAQLSRRDDLRVVVVTGAGNHFMAGGDLKDFAGQLHLSPESRIATFRATIEQHINRSVEAFAALRVPVIARVHGACAGFGLSLAMGCDMVVAADTAYFTTAYSSIALSGDGGVSWFLPRIVGRSKAFELLLLADRFDAAEALLADDEVPAARGLRRCSLRGRRGRQGNADRRTGRQRQPARAPHRRHLRGRRCHGGRHGAGRSGPQGPPRQGAGQRRDRRGSQGDG